MIVILLLAMNLMATGGIMGYLVMGQGRGGRENRIGGGVLSDQLGTGEKYLLYIGLNDKDTYTQLLSDEEARDLVSSICVKYTGGYTASQAKGGWMDETDTLTQENTLVYAFYDVGEEQLVSIMDEILERLNQNSILVERQEAVYTYYSGRQESGS